MDGEESQYSDGKNPIIRENGKFDFSGYQIVRKEFSSHKFDAAITFSCESITFNAACIRFYEDTDYVQILIDEKHKKVAIRKCTEYARHAMQWARHRKKDGKRMSRPIKAPIVCARLFEMMGWDPKNRYKILGTRYICENADVVQFVLEDAEVFVTEREVDDNGNVKRKTDNFLPSKWKDSFGDYVEEHDRKQAIDMTTSFTLFNTPDGKSYFLTEGTARKKKDAETGEKKNE